MIEFSDSLPRIFFLLVPDADLKTHDSKDTHSNLSIVSNIAHSSPLQETYNNEKTR